MRFATTRALFVFVSLNGRITAWGPGLPDQTTAVEVGVDSGAVYTGVAIGSVGGEPRLFVADFAGGTVEAYDTSFEELDLGSGAFVDANLPAGYSPFNVAVIEGEVYVSYALPGPAGSANPPLTAHGWDCRLAKWKFRSRVVASPSL